MKKKTIILCIVSFFILVIIGLVSLSIIFQDRMEYGLNPSQADNIVYIEMYDSNCDIQCNHSLNERILKAETMARENNIDSIALIGTHKNGTMDISTKAKSFTWDIHSEEWNTKIKPNLLKGKDN